MPAQDMNTAAQQSAGIPVPSEATDGTPPPQDAGTTVEQSAEIPDPSESADGAGCCLWGSIPTCDTMTVEQSAGIPVPSESTDGIPPPQDAGTSGEQSAEMPDSSESANGSGTPPQDVSTTVEQSAEISVPSECTDSTGMPQQHAGTSCCAPKSFYDLVTIPSRNNRRVTKRKKMTNFNITSEEHLEFIAVKDRKKPEGQAKEGVRKTRGRKTKYAKLEQKEENQGNGSHMAVRSTVQQEQEMNERGAKAKSKTKKDPKQKPSSRKKQEQSATNSDPCLYCKETLNIGKWIQCQMCAKWAHYECAGADDNFFNFVCELCNCYDTNYCQQYGARVTV